MKTFLTAAILLLLFSCNSAGEKKEDKSATQEQMQKAGDDKNKFKNVAFDSPKDLVCGMPTSAGVSDTVHYNQKVYGFCSAECKDEFQKNPASYVSQK